jgi:hypothetical protein
MALNAMGAGAQTWPSQRLVESPDAPARVARNRFGVLDRCPQIQVSQDMGFHPPSESSVPSQTVCQPGVSCKVRDRIFPSAPRQRTSTFSKTLAATWPNPSRLPCRVVNARIQ